MIGTRLSYMYRDAANYKLRGHAFIAGVLCEMNLRPYMFDGEYFVPKVVGLPSLCPISMNYDDHQLHEIVELRGCDLPSIDTALSADFLVKRFKEAFSVGWLRYASSLD